MRNTSSGTSTAPTLRGRAVRGRHADWWRNHVDERYVERCIDGTYSEERFASGLRAACGQAEPLGRAIVEQSSIARTPSSGTRAAQVRAERPRQYTERGRPSCTRTRRKRTLMG